MSEADDLLSEEQDPALIAEFVSESVAGLQEIESDLLTLESEGSSDAELINRIFRTVHTIKGSGGYLKLGSLVSVAHRAETLLDNIRFGTQDPTPTVTDAILGAIDTLQQMLETPDMGASLDCQATLDKLDAALGSASSGSKGNTKSAAASPDSQVAASANADLITAEDIARMQAAVSGKALVFRIDVDLEAIQQVVDVKEGLIAALQVLAKFSIRTNHSIRSIEPSRAHALSTWRPCSKKRFSAITSASYPIRSTPSIWRRSRPARRLPVKKANLRSRHRTPLQRLTSPRRNRPSSPPCRDPIGIDTR